MTRNDGHLREFIVRALLVGFQHIVICDNNRHGMDYDITTVVAPFVQQGVVTIVPWNRNESPLLLLQSDTKNDGTRSCVRDYGYQADWVATIDTDEVVHIMRHRNDNDDLSTGIGILDTFLTNVETQSSNTCNIGLAWKMLYGEHRVLAPIDENGQQQLLLNAYTRICRNHSPKMLFRADWVALDNPMLPHWTKSCFNPGGIQYQTDSASFQQKFPDYSVDLLHYQKSVEEWLVKLQQSIPPYIRYLPTAYNEGCPEHFTPIHYHSRYLHVVQDIMSRLRSLAASEETNDGGIRLDQMPTLNRKVFGSDKRAYELYLFFKARVERRDEWDESTYLVENPRVVDEIAKGTYVDGLHHYYEKGFVGLKEGPWTFINGSNV